jgi:hypothetical protein
MTGEWSRYYRQAALHDLDVLHERFVKHWFARHSHEFWVIGVVEAGVQAFSYRGRDTSHSPVRFFSSIRESRTPGNQRRRTAMSIERCIRGLS